MNRILSVPAARIALAIISGVLFYFGLRLTPVWWAALLAPAGVLLAVFHASGWEARLMAWIAAAMGLASYFSYYLQTTGPVAAGVLILLQVLLWGFFVMRTRLIVKRSRSWTIVYAYPVLLAGADVLISFFSPHGTWGSFVYTQMKLLPLAQIASILGAPAVIFVAGLISSTVAIALYYGGKIERPLLAYGLPAVLIAGVFGFGFWSLRGAGQEPTERIGIAVVDDFVGGNSPAAKVDAVWRAYDGAVDGLAKLGARIVVLPEKIAVVTPDEVPGLQKQLGDLTRKTGTYLVVGMQVNRTGERDNVSWLIGPSGELLAEYNKQHMVPYLEGDLKPGHENMEREIGGTRYGLAICRDLIFADFGRDYGKLGVSALLVPAWDFYRDAYMASEVATLRGVENGYSVVRAGRESYLHVSDRFGRTIAQKRSDWLPGVSLVADVPLGPAKPTFYSRFGGVVRWVWVFGLLLAMVFPRPVGPSGPPAELPEPAKTAASSRL